MLPDYGIRVNCVQVIYLQEGRKDQKRARVEQSDEGVLLPVQAQGLMEAMGDYATEVYATRVTAGPIDLNDGRKASEFTTVTPRMITTMVGNHFIARVNMQSAQRKLANLMWAGKDQREFREKYAHLEWLLKKNKGQRKQKQKNEKKELDVTAVGLCDMMLEDEDAE